MTSSTASLIDHGSMIVLLGWVAYWRYSQNARTNEKKQAWLVPVACVLVLYHVIALSVDLTQAPHAPLASREKVPAAEDYKAMFKADTKTATEEVSVPVPDGPIILIPKGFKYATSTATAARLAATGKNGEAIALLHLGESSDLAAIEKQLRSDLKPDSPTKLGPSHAEVINGCNSIVMDIGNPQKDLFGKVVVITNGKDAYYLMVAGPGVLEKAEQAQTFRVIHSVAAAVR